MSLQVWLPMIRQNEQNQGLFDTMITPHDISLDNSGKIGKCYSFNTSSTYLEMDCPLSSSTPNFTIAFWVNISELANNVISCLFSSRTESNGKGICIWLNTSYKIRFDDGRSITFTEYVFPLNTWVHICITRSAEGKKLYVNGELVSSRATVGDLSGIGTICKIGNDNFYGTDTTYYMVGKMNDFRIYNHTLSPREVKEISKGLVLHMPLAAPGGENLILNSRNITTDNYALARATADGEKITLTPTTSAGYAKYKATNTPYSSYKNKTYTVSFYARRISGNSGYTEKGLICYFGVNIASRINNILSASYDKYKNLGTIDTITNNWKYYSVSATIPDDLASGVNSAIVDTSMVTFQFGVSRSGLPIEVIPIKFEIGDHPTPWTPNPADPEYTTMGFDDGIEYDVSGYGYNGQKVGDIIPSTTTPRYNTCSLLNSNTSYIVVSGLNTIGFSDSYSISWWAKVTNYNIKKMMWGFADGVRLNGIYYGNFWNTGDGLNNPIYQPGTTTQVSAPTGNAWHHFVMTGNSTKNYLYVDGVLYGESKTYKTITGTIIYINGWSSATDYRYQSNFYISDFRIYATALSAEDVLALYNTPISLSNNGILLTQGELVEVQ